MDIEQEVAALYAEKAAKKAAFEERRNRKE